MTWFETRPSEYLMTFVVNMILNKIKPWTCIGYDSRRT